MSKTGKMTGILAGLALSLSAAPLALAGTVVKQVDADTLRVTEYRGKPPFERRVITRGNNPELFAHYQEQVENDSRPLFATSGRAGPPGKSLPAQRQRIGVPAEGEVAEFARFEESAEAADSPRMWRGAPGKGRPRLTD